MPSKPGFRFEHVSLNDFGETELTDAIWDRCTSFVNAAATSDPPGTYGLLIYVLAPSCVFTLPT